MSDSWKQFLDKSKAPVDHGPAPHLPYEHDESHGNEECAPRENMLQAYRDLMNGLVDTDLHGYRGVEEVVRQNKLADPKLAEPAAAGKSDKP